MFREHNAEADKFSVKTLKRRTVPDHKILPDTSLKYIGAVSPGLIIFSKRKFAKAGNTLKEESFRSS